MSYHITRAIRLLRTLGNASPGSIIKVDDNGLPVFATPTPGGPSVGGLAPEWDTEITLGSNITPGSDSYEPRDTGMLIVEGAYYEVAYNFTVQAANADAFSEVKFALGIGIDSDPDALEAVYPLANTAWKAVYPAYTEMRFAVQSNQDVYRLTSFGADAVVTIQGSALIGATLHMGGTKLNNNLHYGFLGESAPNDHTILAGGTIKIRRVDLTEGAGGYVSNS